MAEAIISLAILLAVTTAIILVLQVMKQPPIIGYIFAGILLGPAFLNITNTIPGLEVFGHIGIAFLLFILGLNIDITSLRQVGVTSVATGLGQIAFTSILGYALALAFGFSGNAAVYVAAGLTFSSTIIIVKLLSDRKEVNSLHGRIAIGFLIVQDIVAVLALMFISSFAGSQQAILLTLMWTVLQAILIFSAVLLISKYLLPYVLTFASKSQEVLFVFSIAWCFVLAGFFDYINFSLEIGALLAGLMLASTPYNYEIASKIKPLRDFFIITFFIILGSQLEITLLGEYLLPAVAFSLLVLIGNPLIVMTIMGWQGFSKRTSFMAGLAVSQISEFGLILVALGVSVSHVGVDILNLTTVIALTTILVSSYCIIHADTIYKRIHRFIPYYQRGVNPKEDKASHAIGAFDVILFGHDYLGGRVREQLERDEANFLVVDFDPNKVIALQEQGIRAVLADANDADLYDVLGLEHPRLVISTLTRGAASNVLLYELRRRNSSCAAVMCADTIEEAKKLYSQKATYVVIPHLSGAEHLLHTLDLEKNKPKRFSKLASKHAKELRSR
ncbi:MAG: cation:proton antiporter [Candidatus Woesearchaeota archaeon]